MPQGSDYIFAFTNKDYNFWKKTTLGGIALSANPWFVNSAPDGWLDVAIENIRNQIYKCIDRGMTIPLKWVVDGAEILKHVLYTKGLYEPVFLTICNQVLDFYGAPIGTLTGGPGLTAGIDNLGTISIPAGFTGYLKITVNSTAGTDFVYGFVNTGTTSVTVGALSSPQVIPINSGLTDYSLFFSNTSGIGTATIELVNAGGLTTPGYRYWYKFIGRFEVDWSTFDHSGSKVTITALEDGFVKYLKANDKVVYEFPINVPEAVTVKLDGIKLHEKLNYSQLAGFDIRYPDSLSSLQLVPALFINNDGDHVYVQVESQQLQITGGAFPDTYNNGDNFIIKNTGPYAITFVVEGVLEYVITERVASSLQFRYRFITSSTTTSNQNLYEILPGGGGNVGDLITRPYSFVITLQPEERLYLDMILNIIGTSAAFQYTDNSKFSIKFLSRYLPTYVKGLRAQYLFDKLIQSISKGKYTAFPSAYLALHADKIWISGNGVRGLEEATIKISLADMFKHYDSIDSVALLDRSGQVDIGTEIAFTDTINFIDLPSPAFGTFKCYIAKELLINQIIIGFPEIRNDVGQLNGNEEFNSLFTFSLDATTITGVLDKKSPCKVSCYDIEKIRTTTFEKNTTDFKNDNDNYQLHIENTLQPAANGIPTHYLINRDLNPLVTAGLLEPETVFNLWFTPKRSLLRNAYHVHGRFYRADQETIYFRQADKNNKLICDGIIEKEDVIIGSLAPAIGVPFYLSMELPPPYNLNDLLDMKPNQVFRIPFMGTYFYGTLENIKLMPARLNSQSILLRGLATNDYTLLIKYFG